MKALELTVYPRLKLPRSGDQIDAYREQWKRERKMISAKRLSDAELAAEYHAWDAHLKHLQWCELASGDELSRESWRKLNARLETLWWFATLTHYDEADQ